MQIQRIHYIKINSIISVNVRINNKQAQNKQSYKYEIDDGNKSCSLKNNTGSTQENHAWFKKNGTRAERN